MLSGNGRHRRPRQAPALLVAAGVAGSAIAIPLLGASGASAASGTTWDAVAECESGGSWSADTGNGLYGGLQMTQETWEEHGGLDYAPSADQASRSQQIAVAEKILADQGTGAWTTCGLVAGLTQDSDSADVDTGVAEDSTGSSADTEETKESGSAKSDSSTGSGSKSADGSASDAQRTDSSSADTKAKGDDSDKSSQNDDASVDAVADSSGRHRGGSAEEVDMAPVRTTTPAGTPRAATAPPASSPTKARTRSVPGTVSPASPTPLASTAGGASSTPRTRTASAPTRTSSSPVSASPWTVERCRASGDQGAESGENQR